MWITLRLVSSPRCPSPRRSAPPWSTSGFVSVYGTRWSPLVRGAHRWRSPSRRTATSWCTWCTTNGSPRSSPSGSGSTVCRRCCCARAAPRRPTSTPPWSRPGCPTSRCSWSRPTGQLTYETSALRRRSTRRTCTPDRSAGSTIPVFPTSPPLRRGGRWRSEPATPLAAVRCTSTCRSASRSPVPPVSSRGRRGASLHLRSFAPATRLSSRLARRRASVLERELWLVT